MNQKTMVMAVVLFILIVVGMFIFAYLKNTEQQIVPIDPPVEQVSVDKYANITRIDGKHFFVDGVHTVAGEIKMPTPCDLLNGTAIIAESYPEQITLDFSVINNSELCAEVITSALFKIEAVASEGASFKAVFQNRPIELNLIEAQEGESPEDFEVFIKG